GFEKQADLVRWIDPTIDAEAVYLAVFAKRKSSEGVDVSKFSDTQLMLLRAFMRLSAFFDGSGRPAYRLARVRARDLADGTSQLFLAEEIERFKRWSQAQQGEYDVNAIF